jgi:hypothetical protein
MKSHYGFPSIGWIGLEKKLTGDDSNDTLNLSPNNIIPLDLDQTRQESEMLPFAKKSF